jgi:hypothetical protein
MVRSEGQEFLPRTCRCYRQTGGGDLLDQGLAATGRFSGNQYATRVSSDESLQLGGRRLILAIDRQRRHGLCAEIECALIASWRNKIDADLLIQALAQVLG